ncbi:MAG: PCRF domain-containing protein, partial [Dehalococcoidia bacterium]|nr:PCRF domain-containing protein [Dehalococcoidia bacterium]
MQEIASLRERVETWRGLETRSRDQVELLELALAEDDDSIADHAAEDLRQLEGELERLEFELQLSGEYDHRDAILAIHAGA